MLSVRNKTALLELMISVKFAILLWYDFYRPSCNFDSDLLIEIILIFSCREKLEHDMVDLNFSKVTFLPKIKAKLPKTTDWHKDAVHIGYEADDTAHLIEGRSK